MRSGVLGQLLVATVLLGSGTAVKAELDMDQTRAPVGHGASIRQVAAGGYTGYAVLTNGRVWAWGDDLEGQIGDTGPWTSRTVPVEVDLVTRATFAAGGGNSAYALRRDGTVFAWGDDSMGELADERFTARQMPRLVKHLTAVSYVSAGAFSVYTIRGDGTAWAWGDNSFGQLGTGSKQPESTAPHELARLRDVVAIAGGSADAYALLKNGTVWAWGDNSLGQLGGGACVSTGARRQDACLGSDVPQRVPDLSGVVAIAAGGDSGYALTTRWERVGMGRRRVRRARQRCRPP